MTQKWHFFMNCERDEELVKGERKRLIKGIASTESRDRHNEELVIAGMDFSNYLEKGHLNWDHMKGPQYILGKPLEAKIVTDARSLKKDLKGPAFYHMCELYDTEPGRAAWDLLNVEKDDQNRSHGFSVEGAVLGTEGPRLVKTRVDDVALTPTPANTDTFAELVKSLTTANTALLIQYVDDNKDAGERANQAVKGFKSLADVMWGECSSGCYDKNMRFTKGAKSAYYHLVKCKGFDEDEALHFVKSLAKSGIF